MPNSAGGAITRSSRADRCHSPLGTALGSQIGAFRHSQSGFHAQPAFAKEGNMGVCVPNAADSGRWQRSVRPRAMRKPLCRVHISLCIAEPETG